MEKRPFIVFSLRGELFAVETGAVREMFRLPELTPVEEAPAYIAGLLNLRKKIMHLIDLNIIFGHNYSKYLLTDSVIVIELEGRLAGIIANEILGVMNISAEEIEPSPFCSDPAISVQRSALSVQFSGSEASRQHFVYAEAKTDEDIVMLLSPHRILDMGFGFLDFKGAEGPEAVEAFDNSWGSKVHDPTPETLKEFHKRAVNLARAAVEEGPAGLLPVAVISMNREYFGVGLELVRGFSHIDRLVPIPCTPEHILGNMNLRGSILTVLDLRGFLGMAASAADRPDKVIVADTGELAAGIAVDDIFDVLYLDPADIKPVPSAIKTDTEQYIMGVSLYNGKAMTILDLKKLLASEKLVVNEEV